MVTVSITALRIWRFHTASRVDHSSRSRSPRGIFAATCLLERSDNFCSIAALAFSMSACSTLTSRAERMPSL